ncbi:uracil-DNA glycosylase [candidate division KSB1 bacterium]|nr:uracil-DNA glycosylase [candidate division KSB1 bacterium]
MSDVFDNLVLFFEQQIELYGNDIGLILDTTIDEQQSSFSPLAWQESASLHELEQTIKTCQQCALSQARNKFVFGGGNPQADIVFVGEAPGADEDRIGLPFVGRAGDMLTKILDSIQLKRTDVYICNILKCRPPQNRDPLPDEIATCKPYLVKQLQLIQPKIIVCLGRIAAQVLLETSDSLTQLRARWFSLNEMKVMVTYHPAALLRSTGYKSATWEDMKRLRQLYDDIKGQA